MSKKGLNHRWFVVVNIYAASKKAGEKWEKAKKLIEDGGVDCEYMLTGADGSAGTLTMDGCRRGFRRFIAVGGDGTVHDVFNAIMSFVDASDGAVLSSDFTLGVIPMGSGNDWIKTLGISKNIKDAVSVISACRISRQDVVRVTCLDPQALPQKKPLSVSYMVNVGGVGIDARVCQIVNHRKKKGERGKILYVKALLKAIKERKASRITVFSDGEKVYEGDYLSIAFGVGKYSGGGMRQTPAAVIDDGLVDMTLIPDLPLGRIAREVPKLFTGNFLSVPELVVTKSRTVEVFPVVAQGALVEVDGEVTGMSPVMVEVADGWINVLVP
ncbi:MAG: diacylglycerol/lipid kinase family protein [Candidatus Cryptobacteroides sp.]